MAQTVALCDHQRSRVRELRRLLDLNPVVSRSRPCGDAARPASGASIRNACNVDLSCLKGFCPSFVTLPGPPVAPAADKTWQSREMELAAALRVPSVPQLASFGAACSRASAAAASSRRARFWRWRRIWKAAAVRRSISPASRKRTARWSRMCRSRPIRTSWPWLRRIPLGTANLMLAADLAVGYGYAGCAGAPARARYRR